MANYQRIQRTNHFKLKEGVTMDDALKILGIRKNHTDNIDMIQKSLSAVGIESPHAMLKKDQVEMIAKSFDDMVKEDPTQFTVYNYWSASIEGNENSGYVLMDWEVPPELSEEEVINILSLVMAPDTILINYEIGWEKHRYLSAFIALYDLKNKKIMYTNDLVASKIEAIIEKYGGDISEINKKYMY